MLSELKVDTRAHLLVACSCVTTGKILIMFTGIVKGQGVVKGLTDELNFRSIDILLPEGAEVGLEIGASVSVDGVCLTARTINGRTATFDAMAETLERSTIGKLQVDSRVNIERAAKDGAEVGGHPLSGHIDCMAEVTSIQRPENNFVMTFKVPRQFVGYIFSKGYIGLNGTSLTVSNMNKKDGTFDVWFIPETMRLTTFGEKKVGDRINLEIERGTQVVVDTVRDFLEERLGKMLPKLQALLGEE
jgi:riboflavin synthase